MGAKRSLPWVRAAVILSLALAAPVDPASAAGRGEPGPVFEARVPLRDPAADLRTLRELDIDVDAVFGGVTKWARVFLVEEEIGKLADLGFALQSSTPEAGPSGGYHTYETLTSELQQVAADHPSLVRLASLGTSVQGRELWMVKITRIPDVEEDEPELRYIAAMHGDEPVGKEMAVRLIRRAAVKC